jgi:hypothetical protein
MKKPRRQPRPKPDDFAPGGFGFHELLDRSCLIAELFSEQVASHPAAKHPKLHKRIKRLEEGLFKLYGEIGSLHL